MVFQKTVLIIATVILILSLVFVGIMIYNSSKDADQYPPVSATCPDHWLDVSGVGCKNVHNLGNERCQGDQGVIPPLFLEKWDDCKKKTMAQGCGITWDGITNNTSACDSS